MRSEFDRQMRRYMTVRVMSFGVMAYAPIFIPFIKASNLSQADLRMVDLTFWVSIILSALAAGPLSDRTGPKLGSVAGRLVMAFGVLLYPAGGLLPLLCGVALVAFGLSMSGTSDEALLKELANQFDVPETEYRRGMGQGLFLEMLGGGVAALFSTTLFAYRPAAPFLLACMMYVVSAVLVLFLKNPGRVTKKSAQESAVTGDTSIWRSKEMRWLTAYQAIVFALCGALGLFYQPYFEMCGYARGSEGKLFCLLCLTAALTGRVGSRLIERYGKGAAMAVLLVLPMSLLAAGSVVGITGVIWLCSLEVVKCIAGVFVTARFNACVDSKVRGKLISLRTTTSLLVLLGARLSSSRVVETLDVPTAFTLLGILALPLAAGLVGTRPGPPFNNGV